MSKAARKAAYVHALILTKAAPTGIRKKASEIIIITVATTVIARKSLAFPS